LQGVLRRLPRSARAINLISRSLKSFSSHFPFLNLPSPKSSLRPRILNALPIFPASSSPQDRFRDRWITSYTIYFSSRPHPLGSSQPYLLPSPLSSSSFSTSSPLSLSILNCPRPRPRSKFTSTANISPPQSSDLTDCLDGCPFGVRAGRAVRGIVIRTVSNRPDLHT
jgi:hypothetical protein